MHLMNVKQLADWLNTSDIDELSLTSPQGHVRLQRGATVPAGILQEATAFVPPSHEASVTLKAQGLGVFLHSHPQRKHSFAQAGDPVILGQCLGLLQVGALLIPVISHCHGVMDAYLQAHGSTVGYGTPLLTIQPV